MFFGSEFSRQPEGLSFSGLRSEFSRSEFSRHPNLFYKTNVWRTEVATSLCIMRDKPKEHVTKEHLSFLFASDYRNFALNLKISMNYSE